MEDVLPERNVALTNLFLSASFGNWSRVWGVGKPPVHICLDEIEQEAFEALGMVHPLGVIDLS